MASNVKVKTDINKPTQSPAAKAPTGGATPASGGVENKSQPTIKGEPKTPVSAASRPAPTAAAAAGAGDAGKGKNIPTVKQKQGMQGGPNKANVPVQNRFRKGEFNQNAGGPNRQGVQGGGRNFRNREMGENNQFGGQGGGGGGPQPDMLPPAVEKKFTGRCRLFIGNLTSDATDDEIRQLFTKYGEVSEIYLSKEKVFAFIRLDTRRNAELAKAELDNTPRGGRMLRVRFATHGAALKVKHINPSVSNEFLEKAFQQFGPVERAIVVVDDRGRSTGEGIIEFARKPAAMQALNRIREGCFLLTASPRPIMVEPLEQRDEEDGLSERNMGRNKQFEREREGVPRFASPGSFEYDFASRWKQLYEMERLQREQLDKNVRDAREKLESEMYDAQQDHQTMMMRQELARRQEELRRIEDIRNQQSEQRRQMEMRRQTDRDREFEMMQKRQEGIMNYQSEGGGRMLGNSGRGGPRSMGNSGPGGPMSMGGAGPMSMGGSGPMSMGGPGPGGPMSMGGSGPGGPMSMGGSGQRSMQLAAVIDQWQVPGIG